LHVAILADEVMSHVDPVASIVGGLALMLLAAKLGGELAIRVRQPAVLGELVAGILLGNLSFGGAAPFHAIAQNETIEIIAGIGALILLFEVGIESTVGQMLKVGLASLLVAVLGVVAPFALGWAVSAWLLPSASAYVHAFIGATLCATSVGITARVFQDLGASRTPEARIILGAAVIDDVLGLVILGAVSGAIAAAGQGAPFSVWSIARITGAALAFLIGALVIGVFAAPRLFSVASLLQGRGVLVTLSLSFCFVLAWASSLIGLAPIVGAFAAGLVLEDVHFKDFASRGERSLEDLIRPISDALVPIFFVLMGLRTDLRAFTSGGSLELAVALIVVAIIGKQACALGVTVPGVNRLAVGIGMIPRGEVGLIFANVGAGLTLDGVPVVGPSSFSAVVLMVIVTTLVTPPALKWSLERANMSPRSRVRL
jgi:Na+:H+ antiporter